MSGTKRSFFEQLTKGRGACLAPMAGFTDSAFRLLCSENNALFTVSEMVSAKALCYENAKTLEMLKILDGEAPCGVQIFGSEEESMSESVKRWLNSTNFSFIDINCGCPVRKVVSTGAGSALLSDLPKLARIAAAVVKASSKPVSAKIRIAVGGKDVGVEAAKVLEQSGVGMVAVHGRSREQFYSGKANLDAIAKVADSCEIPVVGNGDVDSVESYEYMESYTGCASVMVGRGALGNPMLFRQIAGCTALYSAKEAANRHFSLSLETKPEQRAIKEFRAHFMHYSKGCPNAAKLRSAISMAAAPQEVFSLIGQISQ
ncbi:MAG: tRNA-dihydrouridine synthase family protein [Eubacteriaceae bacterium]|nr:tRNA-dihydrouridine synthase family protein [Eubacteriaceae bacterium]